MHSMQNQCKHPLEALHHSPYSSSQPATITSLLVLEIPKIQSPFSASFIILLSIFYRIRLEEGVTMAL